MKAIITRNDQTAVLELPTSRMELAGSLSRIGIRTPAYIIPCSDEEEDYIKVKLFGESDFENELTALVTPKDSLGSVNTTLDLYRELPQTQKEKLKAELSQNPPDSLSTLCRKVMDFQPKYVTEDYYFPLTYRSMNTTSTVTLTTIPTESLTADLLTTMPMRSKPCLMPTPQVTTPTWRNTLTGAIRRSQRSSR